MKDRKRIRRRFFFGGVLVVLVALAVPVTQAIARSARVSAPIEKNSIPEYCGQSIGHSTSGLVSFDRVGKDTLSIAIHSRGAYSADAYGYLYDPDYSCSSGAYIAYLGEYKIVNGSGDKTATVDVSGYGPSFYVCIYYFRTDKNDWYSDCSLLATP
jgi:hypothetical protein